MWAKWLPGRSGNSRAARQRRPAGIWGQEQATGKVATDLARHKKTLPVLYALQHGAPEDRRRLRELSVTSSPDAADVAEIVAILERSGARDFTRGEARRYRDEALGELDA